MNGAVNSSQSLEEQIKLQGDYVRQLKKEKADKEKVINH